MTGEAAREAHLIERHGATEGDEAGGATGSAASDALRPRGIPQAASGADDPIGILRETMDVGSREVVHGRVRVRTYLVDTPGESEVERHSTRVVIERRAVDRAATPAEAGTDGRALEGRETREEAVIGKEARVVEEIRLRSERETRTETLRDAVRSTDVEILDERTATAAADSALPAASDGEVRRR